MIKTILLLAFASVLNARTVSLAWTASVTPGVSYNAYRANSSCLTATTFTQINTAAIAGVTYDDTTVSVGTYCYHMTAVLNGLESVPSIAAQAVVAPLPPTGLTTVVPMTAATRLGGTVQFAANVPVLWSVSPYDMGSIDVAGLYRAPLLIKGNNRAAYVTAFDANNLATSITATVVVRK